MQTQQQLWIAACTFTLYYCAADWERARIIAARSKQELAINTVATLHGDCFRKNPTGERKKF